MAKLQEESKHFDMKTMCKVLEIPRSGYYEKVNRETSKCDRENQRLSKRIKDVYVEFKGIFDAPKIHAILQQRKESLSLKRVQKLMSKQGLRSIIVKKLRPGKSSKVIS